LKAAIIFELYGMLDAAYDMVTLLSGARADLNEGADLLIPAD
jgi:hypothetical protein